MSGSDYVFRFVYPPATATNDMRTVQVKQIVEGSAEEIDFYKVGCFRAVNRPLITLLKFQHPVTGSTTGVTTFYRMNMDIQRWETAGAIEWSSNTSAVVSFGVESVGSYSSVLLVHKLTHSSR